MTQHSSTTPIKVGIIMGSQSDWPTMREAADILDQLGIPYESKIVSAHRTPDRLWEYGKTAVDRGLQVIIAGAGGAAHLPGMMASKTRVPVVGVPVQTKALVWRRLFVLDPTNATRLSCRDYGNWWRGGNECRFDGRWYIGPSRPRIGHTFRHMAQ